VTSLAQRKILLGITAGIAAYKCADLIRRLREQGAEMRVVMTPSAREFIGPLTLQALSGYPVRTELFDSAAEAAMGHIELARWADIVAVAPASADFLARLAHGFADDLLSTLCLATTARVLVAPAMNQQMWLAEATQANVATLQQRGVRIMGPAAGAQACGEVGPGRLLEPAEIVSIIAAELSVVSGLLGGCKVIVTAGPTREPIDPVRYISNRSSGKMGYAVATACAEAGADVALISGPVSLAAPPDVGVVKVNTAEEMATAVLRAIDTADIFIAAAAVADYRCVTVADEKIKKSDGELTVRLAPTPDILAAVAQRSPRPFIVGFAAETQALADRAREKLARKGLDMIAANDVSRPGMGFDSDENALHVLWPGDSITLARTNKALLARQLVKIIAERYREKNRSESP
jgi:phosphopantothenoylcysteine decarboxylase/phosphopantothenate--cysteine ligase